MEIHNAIDKTLNKLGDNEPVILKDPTLANILQITSAVGMHQIQNSWFCGIGFDMILPVWVLVLL